MILYNSLGASKYTLCIDKTSTSPLDFSFADIFQPTDLQLCVWSISGLLTMLISMSYLIFNQNIQFKSCLHRSNKYFAFDIPMLCFIILTLNHFIINYKKRTLYIVFRMEAQLQSDHINTSIYQTKYRS